MDLESVNHEQPFLHIKEHEFREFVNSITKTAQKYEGCQSLRSAIANALERELLKIKCKVGN